MKITLQYVYIIDQARGLAGYWPSSLFAFLWTETKSRSIKTVKRMRPIPSHLDRTSLVNKRFIIWHKELWKKWSLYLFIFEHWKGNQLKIMLKLWCVPLYPECRKYNHLIGYIWLVTFQIKIFKCSNSKQTFVFACFCCKTYF